jgi:predicted RNase H-like HicB family nuclease
MLTYKAAYQFVDDGWVLAQILDFPGAVTQGKGLDDARQMLGSAMVDLVETSVELGKPLPQPNPDASDPDADIEEPIYLLFQGASQVNVIPVGTGG